MRFALIDAEKAEFPVRTMCRVLDVSESGFFSWKGEPEYKGSSPLLRPHLRRVSGSARDFNRGSCPWEWCS